jgi:biotin carboxyl carrier protein
MRSLWQDRDRLRSVELTPLGGGRFRVMVDEVALEVEAQSLGEGRMRLVTAEGATLAQVATTSARCFVRLGPLDFTLERVTGKARPRAARAPHGGLESPMPGLVTRVLVAVGDPVKKGQPLLAIEAMKMEHMIRAPRDGRVRAVHARAGEMVNGGVPLAEMDGSD